MGGIEVWCMGVVEVVFSVRARLVAYGCRVGQVPSVLTVLRTCASVFTVWFRPCLPCASVFTLLRKCV
jgi:hypothetical protein